MKRLPRSVRFIISSVAVIVAVAIVPASFLIESAPIGFAGESWLMALWSPFHKAERRSDRSAPAASMAAEPASKADPAPSDPRPELTTAYDAKASSITPVRGRSGTHQVEGTSPGTSRFLSRDTD